MDKLKEKICSLRMEAEEANARADEASLRVKQLEHELALKEQENMSLMHKNEILESEIERLEQQLMEAKTAVEDETGSRNMSESLQKKIQLLEEELEENDINLRKTTEKLRHMDVKSEYFERKVHVLEKERDDIEAKYEEMLKKYECVKAELDDSLDIDKHTKYHLRHLDFLPHHYLYADTSRISIAFFCLSSLDLLGSLETSTTPLQRKNWIEWIYSFQASNGFRDWISTNYCPSLYRDFAHTASTYFAICILLILKDDMKRLNRKNIIKHLSNLQNEDGSFRPCIGDGQDISSFEKTDIRFAYCAIAILYVLKCKNVDKIIRVDSLLNYIQSCKSYDHGFAENPNNESHGDNLCILIAYVLIYFKAGYTYCAITSLTLLKDMLPTISEKVSSIFSEKTVKWLLKRQLSNSEDFGGFEGRTNKSSDTCYSFWVGGALKCLWNSIDLVSKEHSRNFLLKRIHSIGGFEKCEGEYPDVMHSYFGLAALSIFGNEKLEEIHPALGISKKSLQNSRIQSEDYV
ncbi:hypothetical protein PORY_001196 [Pneumocystis oryctolagi]|uniref:Uncharacterized protein n=1 Tax=Pneumocystis oryctolagi TaxID=42067 RepID=A0ACB7CE41_9ASCO|nr:hypothetical protein PORY_001196 [Pneumocystis oryctolagi]